VGRPREHGESTAAALLAAAERSVQDGGYEALSVRGVAAAAGTTTRAVYAIFGSKDGLVAALGSRAFDVLGAAIAALAVTDDPVADLVEAGLLFRRFALDHPSLFAIGVQRTSVPPEVSHRFVPSAVAALAVLESRITRLDAAGALGGRTVREAACQFHALCEGLAAVELRGTPLADADAVWRRGLQALIAGFVAAPAARDYRPGASSHLVSPRGDDREMRT
jgi:AcrR family transcriptional regulator